MSEPTTRLIRGTAWRALGVITAFVIWWLLASFVAPAGTLLARFGPGEALPALVDFVTSGIGISHTADTTRRLLLGLGTAIGTGIAVGVIVGLSRAAGEATSGVFQFLRMVSPLAWTPIAVAAFGIGDPPVFFLVAVAAVWPVILSTAAGVEQVDPGWVAVAKSLNATRLETVRHVFLPAIRSHVGTGIRLALGTAWIVIVPAEMLGVDSGLGYAILDARDRLDYPELMAIIIWIGILGTLLDLGVRQATRPRLDGKPAQSLNRASTYAHTPFSHDIPA
ncbi:MAG TPA: ABC transporter permease [Acidimicrobiia bacterium]|nr:ABC transporter permease [Acidimicrobiia bacterium]